MKSTRNTRPFFASRIFAKHNLRTIYTNKIQKKNIAAIFSKSPSKRARWSSYVKGGSVLHTLKIVNPKRNTNDFKFRILTLGMCLKTALRIWVLNSRHSGSVTLSPTRLVSAVESPVVTTRLKVR